jgi:hypothetical protein
MSGVHQAQPGVERLGISSGTGRGGPGGPDTGVHSEADLERLRVGAEGALDPARGGDGEGHGGRQLVCREIHCHPGGNGGAPCARRTCGLPTRDVVLPTHRAPEPRHHSGTGEVGAGLTAGRDCRRNTHCADVGRGLHVQVVVVVHVCGDGPTPGLAKVRREPIYRVLPSSQPDRGRIAQGPAGQLEVGIRRLQSVGPMGQLGGDVPRGE